MKNLSVWLVLSAIMYSSTAMAGRCEDLARPKDFNQESAMAAIFCEYDRTNGGTLLPVKYTESWNVQRAEYLATPLLAATYRENDVRKGVVVVQRQVMIGGEPEISHAATAGVSVYVFKYNDMQWEFEKGKKKVLNAGTHGYAPGGRLIKLGPEKFGLWFEGGAIHQGYTNDYAYIVTLSEQNLLAVGHFDTGETNRGACSDDPKDRNYLTHTCWGYKGHPEFIRTEGADYYILRIKYQGTEATDFNERDKIVPKNTPVCYTKSGDKYVEIKEAKCAEYAALPNQDIFGGGETENGKQPIPSIPQKLLNQ